MYKISLLMLLSLMLVGCSCSMSGSEVTPTTSPTMSPTITPNANATKEAIDVLGEETSFGTPIVDVVISEGKITDVYIDEIYENESKRDLKDDYKLSEDAVAPWYQQVETLEQYIVDNGIDAVELADGKVVNEDLMSSVTINVEGYIKTINKAINEAK